MTSLIETDTIIPELEYYFPSYRCFEAQYKHQQWIILHLPIRYVNISTKVKRLFWNFTVTLKILIDDM